MQADRRATDHISGDGNMMTMDESVLVDLESDAKEDASLGNHSHGRHTSRKHAVLWHDPCT